MQLVFLVHGMGSYEDESWKTEIVETLKGQYDKFERSKTHPFEEQFRFKMIKYDSAFESVRDGWKNQANSLIDVLGGQTLSSGGSKILKALDLFNKDEFLATHVLDVLLYRYIPQIASTARAMVVEQILSELNSVQGHMPRWSVISHSLGTAVTHDAFHELYTTKVDEWKTYPLYPKVMAMVSNVSRVLQNDIEVYDSKVNPNINSGGICQRYLNINHEYDPFVQPNRFKPWSTWAAEESYIDIKVNAIEEVNLHSASHYLNNPKVAGALFNAMLSQTKRVFEAEEVNDLHADYIAGIGKKRQELLVSQIEKYAGDSSLGHRIKTSLTPSIAKTWSSFLNYVN
jgi:hypothetical protein